MNCISCQETMIEATTTHFAEIDSFYFVIINVPCMKCEKCGEIVYTAFVTKRIEQIIEKLLKMSVEIAIVKYSDA